MKKILYILVVFAVLGFTNYASAQTAPSCSALGYTYNEADCIASGERIVRCPTDTSKVFCAEGSSSTGSTCESLGHFSKYSDIPNDKKCTHIQVVGLTSGEAGCYGNCTLAPACSTGVGKGYTSANARIELTSNNSDGTCTYRVAGDCYYAGFGSSAARATPNDFGNLLKYFPNDFTIHSAGSTCGKELSGYKIQNGNICVAWYQPTYGSTCSQAGGSSVVANGKTICYKCSPNTSSNASSLAGYFCYQSSGNIVNSYKSLKEMCAGKEIVKRNGL